jgi:AcrR family transcriptional regulator
MTDVTTEYSGRGDPKRSLELLWGLQEPRRRGPKPRLQITQVVEAAIAIADAEGLPALSMRRVADAVGVATMSLYSYLPGKAELLDVMLDTVTGETSRPPINDWRSGLEDIARENWKLFHRHPWILQVATYRPPLGPNLIAKYEYELSTLEGIGLSDVEMDSVLTLVLGYVAGAARGSVEAAQAEQQTGVSDEQWWEATGPLLAQVIDAQQFPIASRVGSAAGEQYGGPAAPEFAFEFGLERVLDGVEAFVTSRQRRGGTNEPHGQTAMEKEAHIDA